MENFDPSPKRHPRTLNEAFPKTAEYGCAIEKPARWHLDPADRLVVRTAIACLLALAAILAFS